MTAPYQSAYNPTSQQNKQQQQWSGGGNQGASQGGQNPQQGAQRPPQSPQWGSATSGAGQAPTFSQMQQQGKPRPAPPNSWYTAGSQPQAASQAMAPQQGMQFGGQNPGAQPPPQGMQYGGSPQGRMAPMSDQGFRPPAPFTGSAPGGMSAVSPPGSQYGAGQSATPGQQGTANNLGSATQSLLLNQLQNPNPLGSQAFQTQMQNAQTGINENMQGQSDAINADLARRGVYDSSLAGGYLKDLSTGAGRQMASIGANLLPQEAQLQMAGTNSALGNANQYSQNQFGQQYGTAQLNLQQQQQQNQQLLQMLGLSSQ